MIDKKDLALMDDLMDTLMVSSTWQNVLRSNPQICAAEEELQKHLGRIEENIGKQYAFALEGLVSTLENEVIGAAMLYGLHVADVIRTVSANPGELSQYILDRMAGEEAGE